VNTRFGKGGYLPTGLGNIRARVDSGAIRDEFLVILKVTQSRYVAGLVEVKGKENLDNFE